MKINNAMPELCCAAIDQVAEDLKSRGFKYAIYLAIADPNDDNKERIIGAELMATDLPPSVGGSIAKFLSLAAYRQLLRMSDEQPL